MAAAAAAAAFTVAIVIASGKDNLAEAAPLPAPRAPPLSPSEAYQLLSVEPRQRLRSLCMLTDDDEGGRTDTLTLTRPFLGRAHSLAADQIARWFADAGLHGVRVDAVGNVRGSWSVDVDGVSEEGGADGEDEGDVDEASQPASVLLIGSHYDTVARAGAYDGALGIVAAVAAVKAAEARRAAAASAAAGSGGRGGGSSSGGSSSSAPSPPSGRRRKKKTVELVAFSDEEGLRFGTTFLGSSALAGTLLPSGAIDEGSGVVDGAGVTLREALLVLKRKRDDDDEEKRRTGRPTSLEEDVAACALLHSSSSEPSSASSSSLSPSRYRGYVEVHMEQGPTLEAERARLSAVSSISGQSRVVVRLSGAAGHAGTSPMGRLRRRDAAAGAAEVVVEVERICEEMSGVARGSPPSPPSRLSGVAAALARAVRAAVGAGDSSALRLLLRLRRLLSPIASTLRQALGSAFDRLSPRLLSPLSHKRPEHLVCTVGRISVSPNAPNVIAGSAELVVDARSSSDVARSRALAKIGEAVSRACLRRSLDCSLEVVHEARGSTADEALASSVEAAARRSEALFSEVTSYGRARRGERRGVDDDNGFDTNASAVTHVARARASGAGHDALALSSPSSKRPLPWAMLFVRDVGGVSHSPLEKVLPDDVTAAAAALHELVVEHVGI